MIPLEMCTVLRGQVIKSLPEDKVQARLDFSTLKPDVRLDRIKNGIQVLFCVYGMSYHRLLTTYRIFNMANPTMSGNLAWRLTLNLWKFLRESSMHQGSSMEELVHRQILYVN